MLRRSEDIIGDVAIRLVDIKITKNKAFILVTVTLSLPYAHMTIANVKTVAELEAAVKKDKITVVNFWAQWCEPCEQMNAIFAKLASLHPALTFINVRASNL